MTKNDVLQKLSEEKEYIQKTYGVDKIGLFGVQYIVECVDKTIHGRGVLTFGVDARRAYQCIVSAVYERVGVEQIEGLHSLYIVIMLTKVRKYSRTIS